MSISPLYSRSSGFLGMRSPLLFSTTLAADVATYVVTPAATQRVIVSSLYYSNNSDQDCISVSLRWGASGSLHYSSYVHAMGGSVFLNFIQCEIYAGILGDSLFLILDRTNAPSVLATVGYYLV